MKMTDLDKKNFKPVDPEVKDRIRLNVMNYNTDQAKTSWTHLAGIAACLIVFLSIFTYYVYILTNNGTSPENRSSGSGSVTSDTNTGENIPYKEYYYLSGYTKNPNSTTIGHYSTTSVTSTDYLINYYGYHTHNEPYDFEESMETEIFNNGKKYNEAFFKEKFLLFIILEDYSGFGHKITSVKFKDDSLDVIYERTGSKQNDSAYQWHIVLEMDRAYSGKTVNLILADQNPVPTASAAASSDNSPETTPPTVSPPDKEHSSFYAIITDISTGSNKSTGYLLVNGIAENDINHRGSFYISLDNPIAKQTIFNEKGEQINQSMLSPLGILVQITYSGSVLESSPAQIKDVESIRIIENWDHLS